MKVYKTQLSPDTSALSALKTISFFAFAIFLNSHRSIDFIETRLLHQIDRVGDLKKEIIGKCEELLPRDVRDNKVMGQFGANHILLGKCVIKYNYVPIFRTLCTFYLRHLFAIFVSKRLIEGKTIHKAMP